MSQEEMEMANQIAIQQALDQNQVEMQAYQ